MAKKKNSKSTPEEIKEAPIATPRKMETFYAWEQETLILNILGTPSAKRDLVGKPKGNQLKVSVTEEPRNGRATDHMVRFLAGEFGVTTKEIIVVSGRFNVNKQMRIKSPTLLPPDIIREETPEQSQGQNKKKKDYKKY